jgi:hypothetical protein
MREPLNDEALFFKRFRPDTANENMSGTDGLDTGRTFREHWRNSGKEQPMIATAVTLAILFYVGSLLRQLIGQNREKILAALAGQSLASNPPSVEVRLSRRFPAPRQTLARPALRAAA